MRLLCLVATTSALVLQTTPTAPRHVAPQLKVEFQSSQQSLQSAVLPQKALKNPGGKLYKAEGVPPIAGGIKAGTRKLCVVTGASSGLGLATVKAMVQEKDNFVICAVRDPAKMKLVAKELGISELDYCAMKLELASLQSVRDFVSNLKLFKGPRALDRLVCNAAVYLPADPEPRFTDDGFEMSMGVNHLGHFLLANLLVEDMAKSKGARVCIVGSITGNTNTIGGGLVYPRASLGDLSGLAACSSSLMADGGAFDGAKAYKDAKLLNMMTVSELHKRYHESTGVTFASMYPGCIAETNLFREKRQWFRTIFPLFMKYVTGGYVGEAEAGQRLAQVMSDKRCAKSGVYWSWNGNAQQVGTMKQKKDEDTGKMLWEVGGSGGAGGELFENQVSAEVGDVRKSELAWDYSRRAVGLE